MKSRLTVLHTYGDVEPVIIARDLTTRAECVKAVRNYLKKDDADKEGGFYMLRLRGQWIYAEPFSGAEIDDAREQAGHLEQV